MSERLVGVHRQNVAWNINRAIYVCPPLLFPLDITWNLSVLLSVFDDMKIVCGGLRSYSHARKVSLKQISRNHLIEKVKKTDPKVTGLFDERTKVGISS